MLDTGSDRDVIDETLALDLDLTTTSRMMNVQVLGVQDLSPRDVASIVVESFDGKYKAEVENALVGNLLTCNSDIPPAKRNLTVCNTFPISNPPAEKVTVSLKNLGWPKAEKAILQAVKHHYFNDEILHLQS